MKNKIPLLPQGRERCKIAGRLRSDNQKGSSEVWMMRFDAIWDLLFPRKCAFCHRLTQNQAAVCPRCLEKLPYTKNAARQDFPNLIGCYAPLFYVDTVRQSLLRYKFGGLRMYAPVYGEFLAKCIDENRISCDSITWVPLSKARLRSRGYDQARLLAEDLAKRLSVPCEPVLRKIRNNPRQSSAGGAENRRRNVKGVYALTPQASVYGKRILLIDDIVTTGATLSECAGVMRSSGAAGVVALTLARRKE